MKWTKNLPDKTQILVLIGALALVTLLGLANFWIGWEYSFGFFYLLPIFIGVHYVGKWAGLFLAVLSGITWLAMELHSNPLANTELPSARPDVCYWNGMALLGFFVIFALLMASVETALQKEKGISRNLETLLTLAPYDQQGWDVHADSSEASQPKEPQPGG
jgi:hypothetical protein